MWATTWEHHTTPRAIVHGMLVNEKCCMVGVTENSKSTKGFSRSMQLSARLDLKRQHKFNQRELLLQSVILLYCCCATSRYVLCSARFSRLIPHCPCKRSSQRVAVVSKPAPLQQPSNGESIRIQQYVHNYERNSPIYHEDAMRQALQQAFGEARDRCTGATAAQHLSEALVPWATAAVLLS